MALAREVTASSRSLEPMGHPRSPPAPGYNHPEATGLLVRGIRSATIIAAVMARCATRVREPRDEGMQCEGVV